MMCSDVNKGANMMSGPTNTTPPPPLQPAVPLLHTLTCAADASTIERILGKTAGVVKAYVNLVTAKAYVEYNTTLTNPSQLRTLLQEAGFGPKPQHVTCHRCQMR